MNTKTALAGLGIGGIAIALGAQKTVENLLGGVFLLSDRALAVGDTCELFAYVLTADFLEFLAVREDLLLQAIAVVESSGSAFAQPTEFVSLDRKAPGDGQPRDSLTHDDVRLAR